MRFVALAALALSLASTAPHPVPEHEGVVVGSRLILYTGPTFVTQEPFLPLAKAVVADETGRVRALLSELPADPSKYDEVKKLPGVLAVPGLHDAHIHVMGVGQRKETVQLHDAKTPKDAAQRVAAYARDRKDAAYVRGRGWDQSRFPGGAWPTWQDLEGATDKPVILSRVDGHAVWVNRALLRLAGIDRATKDPPGGRILRDGKGDPTGILVDNAIDLVDARLPPPTAADLERRLIAGFAACADAGLVAVHDMGMPVAAARIVERLDREGKLPIRAYVYLDASDPGAIDALGTFAESERFEVRGVKLFADGAMGSRGAALLEDYADEPGNKGLLLIEPAELKKKVAAIHGKGFQVAVHAIGDRGNRTTLDVIEQVQGADRSRRHRLEHAQLLSPADFARVPALGVVASMQPTHATSDMRWAEQRLGASRIAGAYAWRTMLDRSAPLAFGSDAPVESERPALGLLAAITRADETGQPPGGWTPAPKLTFAEALHAFTRGAAYAVAQETDLGALTPGMRMDVSVFDADPRGDPARWAQAKATAVVVSGAVRERVGK
jgi:predicted amidohydrolase YtcJ